MVERGKRGRLLGLLGAAALAVLAVWWFTRTEPDEAPALPDTPKAADLESAAEGPQLKTLAARAPEPEPPARRGDGRIRGVVLDAKDRPVAGVAVVARRSTRYGARDPFARMRQRLATSGEIERTTSDARGRFVLDGFATTTDPASGSLPHYEVEAVVAPPRTSTRATVPNWGRVRTHEVVVRVLEGMPLRGRVVDAADRPVRAFVRVFATGSDSRPMSSSEWADGPRATDAEGRFTIPAAPRGRLRFDVFVAGRMSLDGLPIDVPEDGEVVLRLGAQGGGRITGQVTSSDGTPLAGATVLLMLSHSGSAVARSSLLVTTTGDGTFLIERVTPGTVKRISARANGRVDRTWRDVGRAVQPGERTHFELSLLEGATLTGRVTDEEGLPVADARVVAYGSGAYARNQALTDAEGRYAIKGLAPRSYQLYVKARGYYDENGPDVRESSDGMSLGWGRVGGANEAYQLYVEAAGQLLERDFQIQRGLPLSVDVRAEDGTPVAGAQVRWGRAAPPQRGPGTRRSGPRHTDPRRLALVGVTDEQGRLEHPGLGPPTGIWRVAAHTVEACSAIARVEDLAAPVRVTLTLHALGVLRGRVVDAAGQPLPWVTVRLDPRHSETVAIGMTDGDGRFVFERLAAGTYEAHAMMRLRRRGWTTVGSTSPTELGAGADGEFDVIQALVPEPTPSPQGETYSRPPPARETPWRSIEGTVLAPDGTPVESGRVSIRADEGRGATATVLRGRFAAKVEMRATVLTFDVSGARDRAGRAIVHAPFRFGQRADKGPFTLRLEVGGVIAGRVTDDEGNGIAGVQLSVGGEASGRRRMRGRPSLPTARTGADGTFRLEGLAPGRNAIGVRISEAFQGPRQVHASTGDMDLELVYRRGAVIVAHVLGPDGVGLAGVECAAMPADGSRAGWKNGRSGKDGTVRFVGLTQGATYDVRARPWERDIGRDDLMHALVKGVQPGRDDIVLRLRVGAYLEGVLQLPDGSPAARHHVMALAEGDPAGKGAAADEQGAFRVGPFAPGASVSVTGYPKEKTHNYAQLRDVTAPATGLTLRLRTSRVHRARVEGEDLEGFRWLWTSATDRNGWQGRLESDGSFLLSRLPASGAVTVYVYAQDDDRYALAEGVKPEGEALALTLVEGVSIAGSVDEGLRKGGGWMLRAESVAHGFLRHTDVAKDGAFRLRGLPPGRYVLRLHDMQGKEVASQEVAAGAADVVLR